jgi:hypothetical protein
MIDTPFLDALRVEVAALQAEHPILANALSRAFAVVADGALFPEEDGASATVTHSDGRTTY